mgnify:CR=1 FL=1
MNNQDHNQRSCGMLSGQDICDVTIVIPTYNRAEMLSRAICSIKEQTYANWKLVVVDNASSDNTSSIVEEAMRNDARVCYYRHPENIGMLPNWEFALSKVESSFFCLLCDDDYVLPGFLQAARHEMDCHPDIGLCFGRAAVVDNEGRRLGEAPTKMAAGYYEAGHGASAMLKEQNPATPATMFRRDCAKSVGWFDQRSQYVADLDMMVRVALNYPVKFFEEEVACYVVHSDNSFKDASGWHPGLLNLIRNIKEMKIKDESHQIAIFRSFRNHAILPLFHPLLFYRTIMHKPGVIMSAIQCLIETRQVLSSMLVLFVHGTTNILRRIFRKILLLFNRYIKKLFQRFGYRIVKQDPPGGSIVDRIPAYCQDGLFTQHCAAFMKDEQFLKAYAAGEATGSWSGAAVHWRVHVACWLAERASHLEGDLIECGVNRGGTARAIVAYLGDRLKEKQFYLLDTYEGIPESILSKQESRHQAVFKKVYTECLREVMNTFSPFPEVVIVKGLVPNTFGMVNSNKFCFVHIDMNNAQSEIAAAEYLWPRLVTGGFMLLDDYGWQINIDQRTAFNQFAQERGLTVLALPTGQGLLMKV